MTSDHRPRKGLGQNFLVDPDYAARIVAALDPARQYRVVEIGPGHGALTRLLLDRLAALDAIELDRDLAPALTGLPGAEGLTIHTADALAFDFTTLAAERGGPLRLVGNLPYNIATPLIFHLLDQIAAVTDMVFMLQREVVDRIVASPGTRTYGRLSVMVQAVCAATPLFRVPPGAFYPAPKVTSGLVHLRPHGDSSAARPLPPQFAIVVERAFRQRRKTLRNALKGLCSADCLAAAGIDPGARAESLAVADFRRIAEQTGTES